MLKNVASWNYLTLATLGSCYNGASLGRYSALTETNNSSPLTVCCFHFIQSHCFQVLIEFCTLEASFKIVWLPDCSIIYAALHQRRSPGHGTVGTVKQQILDLTTVTPAKSVPNYSVSNRICNLIEMLHFHSNNEHDLILYLYNPAVLCITIFTCSTY